MKPNGTLLLTRREVSALLSLDECIAAVENAFRLHGEGKTSPPGILGIHARDGGFHVKAGLLALDRTYFAAKTNANFPQNMVRFGLPAIQGLIVLCDAENGYPLALMDSMEITILRTGAATAVAAKYLARPDARVATICGCGNQADSVAGAQKSLRHQTAYAFDLDESRARHFADELAALQIEINVAAIWRMPFDKATFASLVHHQKYFLQPEHIKPGTFIAAVGADSPKTELDPAFGVQQDCSYILNRARRLASYITRWSRLGEAGGRTR
jgi:ornithine cyclodeaminase/alanine dehydrogenase-like protein (mu-crystallin family)